MSGKLISSSKDKSRQLVVYKFIFNYLIIFYFAENVLRLNRCLIAVILIIYFELATEGNYFEIL